MCACGAAPCAGRGAVFLEWYFGSAACESLRKPETLPRRYARFRALESLPRAAADYRAGPPPVNVSSLYGALAQSIKLAPGCCQDCRKHLQ